VFVGGSGGRKGLRRTEGEVNGDGDDGKGEALNHVPVKFGKCE
jgi:hypothetical protein